MRRIPEHAVTDDTRFELAAAAAARERRNRPVAPTVAAIVALAAAGLAAVLGLAARASAQREYSDRQAAAVRISSMLTEREALLRRVDAPDLTPVDKPISKIGEMATLAGLSEVPPPPRNPRQTQAAGGTIHEYIYPNIKSADLVPLLDWLRLSAAEIPGLEVYSLNLKPDPAGWTMTVTFRRWERSNAAPR